MYFGISTRNDGSEKIYTGQTRRSVYKRAGEHIKETKKPSSKTYTGKGKSFKLLGSIFSTNRYKAEKTIKKLPRKTKISMAKRGARNYKRKKRWF